MSFNHDNDEDDNYPRKRHVDYSNLEPDTGYYLWKIRLRYWYTSFLIVIVVISLVMIGSIATPRWSEQGSGGTKWRSGLLKCGACQGRWENNYISEIVQEAEDNNIDGAFETFSALRNGGYFYVLFESLALLTALIWIVQISFLMVQYRFLKDKLLLVNIIALNLLHSIGLAGWFGFTGAKFGGSCLKVSDYINSYDVCPSHGPAMCIFIEIFLFMLSVFFYAVYMNRKKAVNRDKFILG
ncbi:hypothetical protein SteCoe_16920 [Stentor coeruleus]|uniref:MARVEL domain-containing protein n=1 Tax=Stentor coeruleus TaxID=5963 RepID=A0A1R2C029_9CILI|nr:hypothetical protein SteCoe_16920 [Stentor coeruleus]